MSKGYGYANIEEKSPMEPTSSVFRAASVSKLFTATALLKLAEKGLVDLNTDINEYLGEAKVPDTYSQPITLAHLLTHTAGFDERFLKVRFDDPQMVTGLYEDVIVGMSPRVRPPGEIVSYSNYGFALAGYIVEAVTGMKFEEYLEENIFKPLNMNHSTFYEPPYEHLQEDMVTMYSYSNNQHVSLAPAYHNQRPAGALYSNIEDLANFAMMHLNNGTYGDTTIITRETVEKMQASQFTHHPELEGRGYGFYEIKNQGGLRVIGHDGDLNGALTYLFLIPDTDFGMIVHFNTSVSTYIEDDPRILLLENFIERFYPDYSLNQSIGKESPKTTEIADISGYYRFTKYAQKSPGKLLSPMVLAQLIVSQDSDGRVSITMPLGMVEDTEWMPYRNDLFRKTDKDEFLAFQKDDKGKVEYLFLTNGGAMALERVPWHERYWVIVGLLVFSLLVFAIMLAVWGISAVIRLIKRKQKIKYSSNIKWARTLTRYISIAGIVIAIFLIMTTIHVMATLDSPLLFLLPVISLMGWILGVSSIVLLFLIVRFSKSREIKMRYSILYSLSAIAGLFFAWILYYGNLLWFTIS